MRWIRSCSTCSPLARATCRRPNGSGSPPQTAALSATRFWDSAKSFEHCPLRLGNGGLLIRRLEVRVLSGVMTYVDLCLRLARSKSAAFRQKTIWLQISPARRFATRRPAEFLSAGRATNLGTDIGVSAVNHRIEAVACAHMTRPPFAFGFPSGRPNCSPDIWFQPTTSPLKTACVACNTE